MILDGFWKRDLMHLKQKLIICSMKFLLLPRDYAEHAISQCLLFSAAIIRKITEDEDDAKKTINKHQMQMPPLSVLKITVPVTRYQHTDEDKFFSNSRVFLDDYDLKNGRADTMPLMQICNQIIHSYAWAVVHQGKRGIYGVLVASDREKEKDIILLTVSDWVNAIQEVIDKANI